LTQKLEDYVAKLKDFEIEAPHSDDEITTTETSDISELVIDENTTTVDSTIAL